MNSLSILFRKFYETIDENTIKDRETGEIITREALE